VRAIFPDCLVAEVVLTVEGQAQVRAGHHAVMVLDDHLRQSISQNNNNDQSSCSLSRTSEPIALDCVQLSQLVDLYFPDNLIGTKAGMAMEEVERRILRP
jgi:hypothetical protein